MPDEDAAGLEIAMQRALEQTALIALCHGEQRSAIAQQLLDNECCDTEIEAAAVVANAAKIIMHVEHMQSLMDEPTQFKEYDRSQELRVLFKAFYQKCVAALASGEEETAIVAALAESYDFPAVVLSYFVDMVESSMSPDIDRL